MVPGPQCTLTSNQLTLYCQITNNLILHFNIYLFFVGISFNVQWNYLIFLGFTKPLIPYVYTQTHVYVYVFIINEQFSSFICFPRVHRMDHLLLLAVLVSGDSEMSQAEMSLCLWQPPLLVCPRSAEFIKITRLGVERVKSWISVRICRSNCQDRGTQRQYQGLIGIGILTGFRTQDLGLTTI